MAASAVWPRPLADVTSPDLNDSVKKKLRGECITLGSGHGLRRRGMLRQRPHCIGLLFWWSLPLLAIAPFYMLFPAHALRRAARAAPHHSMLRHSMLRHSMLC